MSSSSSDRAVAIFIKAIDLPREDRGNYFEEACSGDPALLAEVQALLISEQEKTRGTAASDSDTSGDLDATLAADGSGKTSGKPAGAIDDDGVDDSDSEDVDPLSLLRAFKESDPNATLPESLTEKAGDVIGSYKLLQQIGEGGFGTVWMAEQSEPISRKVALKVIKAGMDTKEVLARFEAERQAVAMMDHTHIAKVLDAGATNSGRPWFAMELVKGIPITEFCDQQKLGTRQRLELFGDVCSAIHHAHQKGVIHRDIKPSNVMVTLDSDKPVVKVIDFGIAKATQSKLTDKTLFTAFEQMIGTPIYMSPEQAGMSGLDIDTRSDIYSLGVLLYELLTGKPPFDGKSLISAGYEEMRRIIREEEPPRPSLRLSTVSGGDETTRITGAHGAEPQKLSRLVRGELDWIVMKAIEKDRSRRYETANAFAADIGRYLNDEAVEAAAPSAIYQLRKFVRRNRRSLVSGALAGAALLAGLAVAGGVWLDKTLETRERMADTERSAATLIDEANRQLERNSAEETPYEDVSAFLQAEDLVHQLDSLVEREQIDQILQADIDHLRLRVASESRDRILITRIEEAEIGRFGGLDSEVDQVEQLTDAFTAWTLNLEELTVDETVAEINRRRKSVRDRILLGLDNFSEALEETHPDRAERLTGIIDQCQLDPWWRKLREAVGNEDAEALVALAESPELSQQPPLTIPELVGALDGLQLSDYVDSLLRRIQREQPTEFWTNFDLGMELAAALERSEGDNSLNKNFRLPDFSQGDSVPGVGKENLQGSEWQPDPKFEEAVGFLRAAVVARPDSYFAWFLLGLTLSNGGHSDEAITSYQQAVQIDPEKAAAYLPLGLLYLSMEKHEEALPYFERATELKKSGDMGFFGLGLTQANLGQYEQALISFQKAAHRAGDLDGGSLVDPMAGGEPITEPDKALAKMVFFLAMIQMNRGDDEDAIATIRLAGEEDPENAEYHQALGIFALMNKGDAETAILFFEHAIELNPDLADAHGGLGLARKSTGKIEAAIASCRRAIELDPETAKHWSNLGAVLEDSDPEQAISAFERAVELDPSHAMAWTNLGLLCYRQNEPVQAISHYRTAIAADPRYEMGYQALAEALRSSKNEDEAIVAHSEWSQAFPESPEAHFRLGTLLANRGDFAAAAESFEQTIALNPIHAAALSDLGVVYMKAGRWAEAIAAFRRSIELVSDYANPRNNLGFLLAVDGEYDEAITHLVMANRLEPANEHFERNLQAVLLASGRSPALKLIHGNCGNPNCGVESLLDKEQGLLKALENEGDKVSESLRNISSEVVSTSFFAVLQRPPSAEILEAFWKDHRDAVTEKLATTAVRIITLPKTQSSARETAGEIREKLLAGENFAELAKTHSRSSTAEDGGLWPDVRMLNATLIEAASSLQVGEISAILEGEESFYLLMVESREKGNAKSYADPKVMEATRTVYRAHLRRQWEERYLARLQSTDPDLPSARVQRLIGERALEESQPGRARPLLENALGVFSEVLGPEDPATVEIKSALVDAETAVAEIRSTAEDGDAPRMLDPLDPKRKQLITEAKQQITKIEITKGKTDPSLIAPLLKLSSATASDLQFDAARKTTERALAIAISVYSETHNVVALCHQWLGQLDQAKGLNGDAVARFQRSLEIRKELLGDENGLVADSLYALGMVEGKMGKLDEAEGHQREALAIRKKLFGNESLEVAESLDGLGTMLNLRGNYAEALKLAREALAIRKALMGNESFEVSLSLNNVGHKLLELGRPEEAETYLREAIEMTKTLGREPRLICVSNLGQALSKQERYSEAEAVFGEALEMHARLHGERGHPDLVYVLHNFGIVLAALDKRQEAEKMERRALEMGEDFFGPDHGILATIRNNLAYSLLAEGRSEDAQSMVEEAVAMARRLYGEEGHSTLLACLSFQAQVQEQLGLFEKADRNTAEALTMARKLPEGADMYLLAALDLRAMFLARRGQVEEAEPLSREALALRRKSSGLDEKAIASNLADLADYLIFRGENEAAESLIRESLDLARKHFEEDPLPVARALARLGGALTTLDRIPEAEEALAEAIALFREHPENASGLADALLDSAMLLESGGDVAGAGALCREAIEILEQAEDPDRFALALAHGNLARALTAQENYSEAETALKIAADLVVEARGRHPMQAQLLNSLAVVYGIQGKTADTEKVLREVLELRQSLHDGPHLAVADSLRELARHFMGQGNWAEAEPVIRDELAIRRQLLGDEDPSVGTALCHLGICLNEQGGRAAEAEPMLRQALAINAKVGAMTEATSSFQLSKALKELGKHNEAEKLARESLDLFIELEGENSREVLVALQHLAIVLEYREIYEEAETLIRRALKGMAALPEQNPVDLSSILSDLGRILRHQKAFDEATRVVRRALRIQKENLGFEHPATLIQLAKILRDQGKFEEADPIFQRVLVEAEKMLGKEHPNIATVLYDSAKSFEQQERFADALPLAERTLTIREKVFAAGHPDFADTFELLAKIHAGLGNEKDAEAFEAKKKGIESLP